MSLLEAGADINQRGNNGQRPILQAAERGSEKLVLWLLENGADITAATPDGEKAVELAARNGYERVVIALLSAEHKLTTWESDDPELASSDSPWKLMLSQLIEGDSTCRKKIFTRLCRSHPRGPLILRGLGFYDLVGELRDISKWRTRCGIDVGYWLQSIDSDE